ncbi:uncharacterized protein FIBRA_07363 [Fibroporia radiculosa]|uniref:Phosphatidylglycerol/phosphatidylinositol transfer protein n=1 Tax=Fibroporia radiculosa TaxID=599839 RepID=J4H4K6_9APHY|nr:uncharacterized protein FIBRA_07363 [Fibroporia radiculosa]CCM05154.1 predicted protein [Fibroporia radiculosa]
MARLVFFALLAAALSGISASPADQNLLHGLAPASDRWKWEDCGSSAHPVHIQDISISPDPPEKGKEMTVTVIGTSSQEIEDGAYADVVVKVGAIKLLQREFDVCAEANANASIQCPVSEGRHVVSHTVDLPKEIPPAPFAVSIRGYTTDDDDMLCLNLNIDFRPKRGGFLGRYRHTTALRFTVSNRHHRRMAKCPLRYLLILDFEATCGDAVNGQNEIIEFPTLVYSLERDRVEATFHEYVRPVVHPTLTPFCTELTGITQDVVGCADTFPTVWKRFQGFMDDTEGLSDPGAFIFLTCGNWDLQSMLPRQLILSKCESALDESDNLTAPFNRFINIKHSFRKLYRLRRQQGMQAMLKDLKLTLEGRHHSGIDDCKNILRIVQRMRADGWRPEQEVSSL